MAFPTMGCDPLGVMKCTFGVTKQMGFTNQIKKFCKLHMKIESRLGVNIPLLSTAF